MAKVGLRKNLKPAKLWRPSRTLIVLVLVLVVVASFPFFAPALLLSTKKLELIPLEPVLFPVTVDPKNKTISEDPPVETAFLNANVMLTAAAVNAGDVFERVALAFDSAPLYRMLAATDAPRFITIEPGFRKEEVAQAFGTVLDWDKKEQAAFLHSSENTPPLLSEGSFFPSTYILPPNITSTEIQSIIKDRFEDKILSRYGTSTEEIVPLWEALTIASMIERETADRDEMRVISGVIWNRIFADMKLQIDATIQYAKGTSKNGWWPTVRAKDKFISSPYNTYLNPNLPPAPISNPSVAAVFAALNPKKTSCFYYFHDTKGDFHCSDTYKEHVRLLKKYFGRGK